MHTEERRDGKRFPSQFGVVFGDGEGLNFSVITNLSRSGVYLFTRRGFPIGKQIDLKLSNGHYEAPIQATVVRSEHRIGEFGPVGVGLAFNDLSPAARRLRDDLLLYLMSLKYHQDWPAVAER